MCLIVFDLMVYPDPKFLIFKTKKRPHFFSKVRGCFFILCYHARHLQQIHSDENFCRMYVLSTIVSVATLNICQILMRLYHFALNMMSTITIDSNIFEKAHKVQAQYTFRTIEFYSSTFFIFSDLSYNSAEG